ncbi:MAG: DUF3667 domain-containing protein [Bacteroidota bacterium]
MPRISIISMYADFQSRIYGFDGMFPRTLRDLTLKPGVVAREYIKGNRVRYYGPVGYFFLTITVTIIMMSVLDISFQDFMKIVAIDTPKQNAGQEQFQTVLSKLITDNLRLFSFLIVPFITASAWLFFRKSKLNFLEHSVPVFYTLGHLYWLTILNLVLYKFFDTAITQYVLSPLTIFFYALAGVGFYQHQAKWKVAVKSVLTFVVAYLLFFAVFAGIILIYALNNPEFQEMIKPKK